MCDFSAQQPLPSRPQRFPVALRIDSKPLSTAPAHLSDLQSPSCAPYPGPSGLPSLLLAHQVCFCLKGFALLSSASHSVPRLLMATSFLSSRTQFKCHLFRGLSCTAFLKQAPLLLQFSITSSISLFIISVSHQSISYFVSCYIPNIQHRINSTRHPVVFNNCLLTE